MKCALLALVIAAAVAVAPPRIELDLTGMSRVTKRQRKIIKHHQKGLGYSHGLHKTQPVLSRQDWTQRCPAGASNSVTCPQPRASAYDHNNGVLEVKKRIFLINLEGKDSYKRVSGISYAKRASYLIKFDAQDHSGNHAEQIVFALILDDTTNPVISMCMPKRQTVEANTNWKLCTTTFATDNLDSKNSVTRTLRFSIQNRATGRFLCKNCYQSQIWSKINTLSTGEFLIVARAHDFAGVYGKPNMRTLIGANNRDVNSAIVTVVDTTKPIITVWGKSPAFAQCGNSINQKWLKCKHRKTGVVGYLEPVHKSKCPIFKNLPRCDVVGCGQMCEGDGECGTNQNMNQCNPGNWDIYTRHCGRNAYKDAHARARDSLDTKVGKFIKVIATNNLRQQTVGDYKYWYNAKDSHGNRAQQKTRIVQVRDTLKPTVTYYRSGSVIVHRATPKSKLVDPGVICTDQCDKRNIKYTTTWGKKPFNKRVVGTYVRTYFCKDRHSNVGWRTRNFIVVDRHAPVITILGANPTTWEASWSAKYKDAGARCNDWHDGVRAVSTSFKVNLAKPGYYYVTYTCFDKSNNKAITLKRKVRVMDRTCPQISRNGKNVLYVEAGFKYVDAGARAYDNIDRDITKKVVKAGDTVTTSRQFIGRYDCGQIKRAYPKSNSGYYFVTRMTRRVRVYCNMRGKSTTTLKVSSSKLCYKWSMKALGRYHCQAVDKRPRQHANPLYSTTVQQRTFYAGAGNGRGANHANHRTMTRAEVGKYVISYKVKDAAGNKQCRVIYRTVIVRDTLPPIIVMRLNGKKIQMGAHKQRGLGKTSNGRAAAYAWKHLMAESAPASSVNGWIIGAIASAVTGLALVAYANKQ